MGTDLTEGTQEARLQEEGQTRWTVCQPREEGAPCSPNVHREGALNRMTASWLAISTGRLGAHRSHCGPKHRCLQSTWEPAGKAECKAPSQIFLI